MARTWTVVAHPTRKGMFAIKNDVGRYLERNRVSLGGDDLGQREAIPYATEGEAELAIIDQVREEEYWNAIA